MNIVQAVKEAHKRISSGEDDPLAMWILDTFALPLARFGVEAGGPIIARTPDLPDVDGWGLDTVEIGEGMTGTWDADNALGIATVILYRAEDARDDLHRDILG